MGLRVKDGELVVATVWRSHVKGQVEVGDKVSKDKRESHVGRIMIFC